MHRFDSSVNKAFLKLNDKTKNYTAQWFSSVCEFCNVDTKKTGANFLKHVFVTCAIQISFRESFKLKSEADVALSSVRVSIFKKFSTLIKKKCHSC